MHLAFNACFFTLLLFCAYIALAQWRVTGDAAVPWYIGYLAATFLHYGRQFWIDAATLPGAPPMPDPPLEWDTPLSYAAFACYFLFVRRMLQLGTAAPPLHRALGHLARFLGLMSGGHLLVQALFGHVVADTVHQVFQVLLLPALVVLVAKVLRHAGLFYQKLVLAGTAALVLGYVCVIAQRRWTDEFFLLPEMVCCFPLKQGAFCLYHLKVGVALDVLCFSWALSLRQRALLQAALLPASDVAPLPPGSVPAVEPPEPAADEPEPPLHRQPQPNGDFLKRLYPLVEERYPDEGFGIREMALSMGISPGQLNRKIKNATGLTTEQFLLCYRLERARERLLADPETTVSQVVPAVGLKDLSHFSRAYKKRYGESPREVLGRGGRQNAF